MNGIKKLWYIYTTEYYSVIKRDKFESVLVRGMNLVSSTQSKSEREKQISHNNIHTESRKMVLMNSTYLFVGQE